MKVIITGASGSGTTTLGRALGAARGWRVLDTDDYYWLPTDPPYQQTREPAERQALLRADLAASTDVVASGSVMGWGADVEDVFDLVVFLYLDADIRVARLRVREEAELGSADPEFLAWAADYDSGPATGRSLAKHRAWLDTRSCPVLELVGDLTVDERLARINARIAAMSDQG